MKFRLNYSLFRLNGPSEEIYNQIRQLILDGEKSIRVSGFHRNEK